MSRGWDVEWAASGPEARAVTRAPCLVRGQFFSLGGLLASYARTRSTLAPWTLSAAVLVALASWDPMARGGGFDITLLGLAAYELLIALTQPAARTGVLPGLDSETLRPAHELL